MHAHKPRSSASINLTNLIEKLPAAVSPSNERCDITRHGSCSENLEDATG